MSSTAFSVENLRRKDVSAAKRLCSRTLERRPDRFATIGRAAAGGKKDVVIVAKAGREIVGVVSCGVAKPRGREREAALEARLDFVAVASRFRRRGVASALWQAMERELVRRRVSRVGTWSRVLDYGVDIFKYPAVTTFLLKAGFDKGEDIYDMEGRIPGLDLDTSRREMELAREGFEIRRIMPSEKREFRRFLLRRFRQWIFSVRSVRKRGRQVVHVAMKGKRMVGFSASGGRGFGPIGVEPKLRWKGIGRVLLLRCLADIRDRGHKSAFIGWANFPFYARTISAPITKVLWRMEKRLQK